MRASLILLGLLACEPPKAVQQPDPMSGAASASWDLAHGPPHADACRDDIPDCVAACALRETRRNDYLDFYDRRCAAAVLGKNPDKVPAPPPVETASTTPAQGGIVNDPPFQLTTAHDPFDPTSVSRTGGSEPAECRAARLLKAQKRDREADMLQALCIAKGGGSDGGI